jgi:uncharacterized protein YjbI with pentapeptide repeats
MNQPRKLDSPLYAFLHEEDVASFNRERAQLASVDLKDGDFRGLDLRELHADGIDFTGAYFRTTDLRGLDLRNTCLEGASLAHAQISGTYFPVELSADEILMSLKYGTRLRYRSR